jgi:hypothetical protein
VAHQSDASGDLASLGRSRLRLGPNPPCVLLRSPPWVLIPSPPCSSINGRSGIRTHAGFRPHDFQSCALSHSATRPGIAAPRRDPSVGPNPRRALLRRSRGSEPQNPFASHLTEGVGLASHPLGRSRLRFDPNPLRVLLRSPPWVLNPTPPRSSPDGGSGIRTHEGLLSPTP